VGSERQASRDGVLAEGAPALKRWSIGNPMIRLFHLYVPSSLMVLFLVDVALLYSSISLGFIHSYASVSDLLGENTPLLVQRVLFVAVVMLSLFTMGLHHRRYIAVLRMVPLRLAASHVMAFVILTLVFYVVPGTRIWLSAFLPALGISFRLPTNELLDCRLKGLWISDFSSFMERETGQVELQSLDPSWLIFSDGFSAQHRIERMIKRIFDICASAVLLTFAMPVAVMAALAIRLEDGGPIFYRQQRVGLHGRPFMLLKFRSMGVNAESDGVARWAAVDDQRVTRVGAIIRKTRVDEIPQVINVLKGEMSFVGPRPERPTIVDDLGQSIPYYQYRHVMKPGITGWAQISYPYGASVDDAYQKLKFDLYYIKNYSLVLDFLILIQTIRVVLWPQGAR
jgi:lipopolysaccharide/colanic/teichoic acid biosynthesis glycosyltransferase